MVSSFDTSPPPPSLAGIKKLLPVTGQNYVKRDELLMGTHYGD